MINRTEITEKLLSLLEKMPSESLSDLQKELCKVFPAPNAKVLLKTGSGAYEEDEEYSVGIFFSSKPFRAVEADTTLNYFFQSLFDLATEAQLERLDMILERFRMKAKPLFSLDFIPAQIVEQDAGGIYFTLEGQLAV
jgi:hypothetical protein